MSNNFYGKRWLETKEFVNYLSRLLCNNRLNSQLWRNYLNFFEEIGLFFPILRIELPETLIRRKFVEKYPDLAVSSLPIEGEKIYSAWKKLQDAQLCWKNINNIPDVAEQCKYHPFDEEINTELKNFFQYTNNPLKNKTVVVGQQNGTPLKEEGIYDYYHFWQALKFAEIFIRTGILIHYNPLQEEISDIRELIECNYKSYERRSGISVLNEFEKFTPVFNAVAFFYAYSYRALNLITLWSKTNRPNLIEGDDLNQFKIKEKHIAHEALERYGIEKEEVYEFIEWLCKQWHIWSNECQLIPALIEEYKQHIITTIRLYQTLSEKKFVDLVDVIGKELGLSFYREKPILKVIFPDEKEDTRKIIQDSFIKWVKPSIDKINEITINEQDCVKFVDWIEEKSLFQLHWHFRQLKEIWKKSYQPLQFSALVREVVGLGVALEYIAGELITIKKFGLDGKLKEIWQDIPLISSTLGKGENKGLFPKKDYKNSCQDLLNELEQWDYGSSLGNFSKTIKLLHKAIIIRNSGSHGGLLKNFETNNEDIFVQKEQLEEYILILLQVMILSWKQANP